MGETSYDDFRAEAFVRARIFALTKYIYRLQAKQASVSKLICADELFGGQDEYGRTIIDLAPAIRRNPKIANDVRGFALVELAT